MLEKAIYKSFKQIMVGLSFLGLIGTTFADTKVKEMQLPVPKCSSPVYNVSIMDFGCKAAACTAPKAPGGGFAALAAVFAGNGGISSVGKGVTNMLTTALQTTNCFHVIDLKAYKKMQALLAATGQKVKPPHIDYMITGDVTSISLSTSGGALGAGLIPVLGLISERKQEAQMGIDINVLNPATAETVLAKTFQADSSKTSWGIGGAGAAGMAGAAGGWSISHNLSLDNVARSVVIQAATYITKELAGKYITYTPPPPGKKSKDNSSGATTEGTSAGANAN